MINNEEFVLSNKVTSSNFEMENEELEKKEKNITVEVIDFLDGYTKLCQQKKSPVVKTIQKLLQVAIDGGHVPKKLDFRGTCNELKYDRINNETLENVLKPLSSSTFLREINLSFNEIGDKGAMEIASYIKCDLTLEVLHLNSNNIGVEGGTAIAQALLINESLFTLNIAYNHIKDEGGMEFASMLQINKKLCTLNLSGCSLNARSIIALSTVLQNNSTMKSITLTDNRSNLSTLTQSLQNDVVMHLSRMLKLNTFLQEIGLAKLGITDWSTIDMLSKALKISNGLRVLDLSCNKISRDGGVAICQALHDHPTLRTLKLSCCSILDEGAEAVGEFLSKNKEINNLYLDHNGISGVGLEAIAKGIMESRSLFRITLWGNIWDVAACEAFSKLIGGVVCENKVGVNEDILPDVLHASNLKNLNVTENFVDSKLYSKNSNKAFAKKCSRLNKNQVDFVVYSVEGVLNIAHQELVENY
ncbi:hypothetical protein HK099_008072 [Clydaea vesicula]|uniref:Uncharacterized protein n=1 Tax=Clydaea vesicula TaxID=447962 RepID=A0AAD5U849_9FUNG|nr:hypothetical protein HK099_008072 [Clydaea vesicula]KAJ3387514.1 hypothetical protein HDU92_001923 [Lobulomyces angularis]